VIGDFNGRRPLQGQNLRLMLGQSTIPWQLRASPLGTAGAHSLPMTPQELRARSMRFAVRAVRFARTLPATWDGRKIGGQLIDSATSVAINYRAAGRGRSHREFTAKIGVVVEEVDETVGWVEMTRSWNSRPTLNCSGY
jgi:four helix bundle protein